ncbi:MAG: DUF3142 domain-containing protein [Pyrinomonadaceae bacterium]
MSFALPYRLPASRRARVATVAVLLLAAIAGIARFHPRPRPWKINDVPIAFWAWRNQAPTEKDVRAVIEMTQARTLFLRAGQIDYHDGRLRRIRAVTGSLPNGIDLHLVYNGTRSLLSQLETVDEKELASAIATAFHEDTSRAEHEHAHIIGLQIDIDVPTRLLGRYEKTLRTLRVQLKPGTQLSITGLPTWMQSSELQGTLAQVDFWVPQFYGAEIPERVDQMIPISSPNNLDRFVDGARGFNKPFYAGLAAYSCALLYNAAGSLITLRGDMDPATIGADPNLELTDQRPFERSAKAGSEWRYAYRARADGVTDGLAMHAGDLLVVDVPSTESLRASARIVRELAGNKLLGICVFRLPAPDDPSTLNAEQVATALSDGDSSANIQVRFKRNEAEDRSWLLEIENTGAASAVGGLRVDLDVDVGTIQAINPESGESAETICRVLTPDNTPALTTCSPRRANMIRINAAGLRPGQMLKTRLVFTTRPPQVLSFSVETQTDAGDRYIDRT